MTVHHCDPTINQTLIDLYERRTQKNLAFFLAYMDYHPYVSSLVSGIGVIGNFILFAILIRPSMLRHGGHGSVNVLLAAIAVADFFTNLTNLCYVVGRLRADHNCDLLFIYSYFWNFFVLIHADLSVFLHATSLYLTVALAAVRVVVLCCPGRRCSSDIGVGCWLILTTLILVGVSCMPNFLRNGIYQIPPQIFSCSNETVSNSSEPPSFYRIQSPPWWDCTWEQISFWTNGVMAKIIPCFLLTVFMALLVHIIIVARRRHERLMTSSYQSHDSPTDRTSVLLFSIVFIFWLTELPQGVILIWSAFDMLVFTIYKSVGDFLDLLSLLNSSVNFALYCSMSAKFRQEFMLMLQCTPVIKASLRTTELHNNKSGVVAAGCSGYPLQQQFVVKAAAANHYATDDDDALTTSLLQKNVRAR